MNSKKIKEFQKLAGQKIAANPDKWTPELRKLGAQLLLSETLEYVIKGLGVIPEFNGTAITDANALGYSADKAPDKLEMLDGLSDVAYTMYWNSESFGLNLEEAFDAVCDNNLEKFVKLANWKESERPLEREEWNCGQNITWPTEVVSVEVVNTGSNTENSAFYAVGKDKNGKVRKPSSYKSVDLNKFL